MAISVFDMFKVGIGPSSSHTVGPMRAAISFADRLHRRGVLDDVARVRCELFGSLGATGHGHGSVKAVVLGLEGEQPDMVDPVAAQPRVDAIARDGKLTLAGLHPIEFSVDDDVVLHRRRRLEIHSNGMRFLALAVDGSELDRRDYYSVGGGFVLDEDEAGNPVVVEDQTQVPYPFRSGADLLVHTRATGLRISDVMLANELTWRSEAEVRDGLLHIWSVMQECVQRGIHTTGVLPGGLKVRRRAAGLYDQLAAHRNDADPLRAMEWVTMYALAVNEENAAGGRVVTAPTNGAAGIVPAVLHFIATSSSSTPRTASSGSCSPRPRSGCCSRKTPRSPALRSVVRGRSARPARWPPRASPTYWAPPRNRWRTPPRSASSTTWDSPATPSADSSRSPASSATPSARSRRSPQPGWRATATDATTSPSTRRSRPCATPAPT
jgi:iron-sulfur-dependent L-serine dehydratase single chain form